MPRSPQLFAQLVLLNAALLASACTSATDGGSAQPALAGSCVQGATNVCTCGTSPGSTVCTSAGTWDVCHCETSAPAAGDAGAPQVDATTGVVSGPGTIIPGADAGAQASAGTGLPCDVASILEKNCAGCHGAQTMYGAPMSLVTWDDLNKAAPVHTDSVTRELALARMKDDAMPMPPAPHARVGADEIAAFESWITQGAPKSTDTCAATAAPDAGAGDPTYATPKPADCEETYEITAHGGTTADDKSKFRISSDPTLQGNEYHCFYFDPPYAPNSGVLWFQPIIDNTANLHHWILYATENATHAPGTSAPCNAAEPNAYFVAGWAPGADNVVIPDDMSLDVPSGSGAGLILEVHYFNQSMKEGFDASGVRFCTTDQSKRTHVAGIHQLGTEGICVPPNTPSKDVVGNCDPRDDMGDIHITGVWPHMHITGRRQQLVLNRKDGTTEMLHDAPFDFNSQVFYPVDDIVVHPGDTLDTHCFYENTTTQPVHFGERTQDEMCYAFVMAWPVGALTSGGALGGGLGVASLNRCANDLSILDSCNGLSDAPMTVNEAN